VLQKKKREKKEEKEREKENKRKRTNVPLKKLSPIEQPKFSSKVFKVPKERCEKFLKEQ
jgi:hypothetical protein